MTTILYLYTIVGVQWAERLKTYVFLYYCHTVITQPSYLNTSTFQRLSLRLLSKCLLLFTLTNMLNFSLIL